MKHAFLILFLWTISFVRPKDNVPVESSNSTAPELLEIINTTTTKPARLQNVTSGRTSMPKTGTASCQEEPVYLTSILRQHGPAMARESSRVDDDFLESFVPPSYAGLITVNDTLQNNLFFWFFPSPTNSSAPLLLWLNGGPTVPSMLGLFHENGPMKIDPTSTSKNPRYSKREHSWVGPFSMLYVDNPVNVGFSTSLKGEQGDRYTEEGYTKDLYNFLTQFFIIFPSQKQVEFYIGGQSYAGMYVTSLAHYIHTLGTGVFPMAGIYLGGPFFDPQTQLSAVGDFRYHEGSYSYQQYLDKRANMSSFFANISAFLPSNPTLEDIFSNYFSNSMDNFVSQAKPPYLKVKDLMDSYFIRRAVHMGDNVFYSANYRVREKFGNDSLKSRKDKMAVLMDNYKVLIFNGNLDTLITTAMIEASVMTIPWSHRASYLKRPRSFWYKDELIKGFFSREDKFCRVIINGAGHQVPYDKPESTLKMMKDFVNHGCIL